MMLLNKLHHNIKVAVETCSKKYLAFLLITLKVLDRLGRGTSSKEERAGIFDILDEIKSRGFECPICASDCVEGEKY